MNAVSKERIGDFPSKWIVFTMIVVALPERIQLYLEAAVVVIKILLPLR